MAITLRGRVQSGRGEAAGFLVIPWVAEQLRKALGGAPYPGTLNLKLADAASLEGWQRLLRRNGGPALRSPDPAFCDAACLRTVVGGELAALVVVPRVPGYPPDVVEVVAGEGLRDRLGVADGDEVTLTFPEADA